MLPSRGPPSPLLEVRSAVYDLVCGDLSFVPRDGEASRTAASRSEDAPGHANGDGLPDAWERSLLTQGKTINDIKPGDDSDGDGMSNLDEYISGNYAFDKDDGLRLGIIGNTSEGVLLEFMGLRGRTYTLHGTHDFKTWIPLVFKIDGNDEDVDYFRANNIQNYKIIVSKEQFNSSIKFFKLMVQ